MPVSTGPYTISDTLYMLKSQVEGFEADCRKRTLTRFNAGLRIQGMKNLVRELAIWTRVEEGRIGIPAPQENASLELAESNPGYSIRGVYDNTLLSDPEPDAEDVVVSADV